MSCLANYTLVCFKPESDYDEYAMKTLAQCIDSNKLGFSIIFTLDFFQGPIEKQIKDALHIASFFGLCILTLEQIFDV